MYNNVLLNIKYTIKKKTYRFNCTKTNIIFITILYGFSHYTIIIHVGLVCKLKMY